MSYCRFNKIDSDVYMYPHVDGYIECCGCKFSNISPTFYKRTQAIHHLLVHKRSGHKVPKYAFARLREEIKEFGDDV